MRTFYFRCRFFKTFCGFFKLLSGNTERQSETGLWVVTVLFLPGAFPFFEIVKNLEKRRHVVPAFTVQRLVCCFSFSQLLAFWSFVVILILFRFREGCRRTDVFAVTVMPGYAHVFAVFSIDHSCNRLYGLCEILKFDSPLISYSKHSS